MARLRRNFQSGFVSGPLTATGSTATLYSPELANLPVVTAGDFFLLVLDPNGEYGAPEIVHLTAHAANATSGTITRAQENTVARVHPLNTRWINALAASDLDEFITSGSGNQTVTGQLTVVAGSATTVAAVIKGAVSQTANLTEWRDSGNVVRASIGATGFFENSDRMAVGSLTVDPGATLNAVSRTASERAFIARAAASPTVNIAEFQSSAAAILASVSQTGAITSASSVTGTLGTFRGGESSFSNGAYVEPDTGVARAIKVGAGGVAVLGGIKTDTLTVTTSSTISGPTTVNDGMTLNGAFTGVLTAATQINSFRAAAAQTANILEFRNSASAVLSRVDASGFIFEGANRVYSAATPNLAATVITANTYGLAAVLGTGTTYARHDHHHGTPPAQVISVSGAGITATLSGVNYTLANTGATSVAGRTGAVVLTAADIAAGTFPGTAYTFTGTAAGTAFLANSDGTVAAPAFRFGTASNTGLYSPGTDIVGLAAGGLEVFRSTNAAGVLSTIITGTLNTTGILTENGVRVYSATTPNLATTVTTDTTYAKAAVVGTGTLFARNDHSHGTPPSQVISAGAGITSTASGVNYTITNTGVLSNVAGAGISVSGATGNVTVTNTGVLSAVAGTNIAVSGGTGNVTFSTVAAPTFSGDVTAANYQTTGTYNSTAGGMSTQLAWNELFFTRVGASYIRQHGIGGSLVFTTSNVAPGDVTALTLAANGGATFGTTLAVTGASTFTGLTTHTGGLTTPGDIAISSTGGQLNLSASGGTVTGTGTGIGDKINLYAADYGFGIQSNRLVAFINNTATTAFAIRATAASGNKSSGTDVHTFFSNGNATHTGTLTVNSTSTFTGRTTHSQGAALTAAAATIPLVVTAGASTTVDVAQFTTGTVTTRIASDGSVNINGTSIASNALYVGSLAAAGVVGIFRGATSQTGDLTQWQSTGGTVVSKIDKDGNFYTTNRAFFGTLSFIANYTTYAQAKAAGEVVSVYRGAASQTGDLTQWQNSAGTVLADVDSSGYFMTPAIGVGTSPSATYPLNVLTSNDSAFNIVGGTGRTLRMNQYGVSTNTTLSVGLLDRVTPLAMLEIYNGDATPARQGIRITGALNQTGDLLDFRKSDGTQVARIDANGVATFSGQITSNGSIEAVSPTATTVTFSARGAVGQTANLTEWRNSAGTTLSYVTADGSIFDKGSAVVTNATLGDVARTGSVNAFTEVNTFSGHTLFQPAAATVGTVIRATAGHTANLTEWQSSTPAVTAAVTSSGSLFTTGRISAGSSSVNTAGVLYVSAALPANVAIAARAAASQTADLTQWQNSAGAVLSRVDAAGLIYEGANRVYSAATGMATATPATIVYGGAGAVGTGTLFARNDHVHPIGAAVTSLATSGNLSVNASSGAVTLSMSATPTFTSAATALTGVAVTTNLSASPVSWTRVATFSLGAQYADAQASILFLQKGDGSTSEYFADVIFRAKQQAPFGTNPLIDLTVVNAKGLAASNFAAVIVSNAGPTVVDLYLKIPLGYQQYDLFPSQSNNTGTITWRSLEPLLASLPAGTVVNAVPDNQKVLGSGDPIAGVMLTTRAVAATDVPVVMQGAVSQTNDLTQWRNSANSIISRVMADGGMGINYAYFGTDSDSTARVRIATGAVGTKGLVVRAAASQTASLQEWQNSAGTILTSVSASGVLTAPAIVSGGSVAITGTGSAALEIGRVDGTASTPFIDFHSGATATDYDARLIASGGDGSVSGGVLTFQGATLAVQGSRLAAVPMTIRGSSGQTANITEWQDSAGAILSRITKGGSLVVAASDASSGSAAIFAQPSNVAHLGIVVRSVASQAGNLQEWQNTAATALSMVQHNGSIQVGSTGFHRSITINALGPADSTAQTTAPGLLVGSSSTTTVNIVARAAVSQTANLAEWQNSAGTVLSSVGPQGRFTATAGSVSDPGIRFTGDTNTGFYRNATDSVAITTAGSIAASWDAAGQHYAYNDIILTNENSKLIKSLYPGTQTGTNKAFDHIVGYASNSASVTGAIQFIAPYGFNTMMQKLSIEGYTYDSNGPLGIELGFYNSGTSSSPTIVNSGYSSEGSLKPAVRVGYTPAATSDMAAPGLSTATTGGTLAAGTYNYRVSALVNGGETRPLNSAAVTTTGTTSTVTVTWTAVANATGYRIWRTAAAGAAGTELLLATLGVVTTYTDTGAVTPAGALPTSNTSYANSKVVITLGDVNTVWQYPKFFITRAITTHSTHTDTVMDGWTSGLVTSFSHIGAQVTVANKDGVFQNITVSAAAATGVPAIFRGAASQTADLLQFQNSAGTTMSRVAADGSLNVNIASISNNALAVQSMAAAGVPTIFRGATSQTGDLTQWQNVGGTVLSRVGSDGSLNVNIANITNNAFAVQSMVAAGIPSIIRGATSQTGDLTQWQNVSGTVLSRIGPDGSLNVNSTNTVGNALSVQSVSASGVIAIIRGAASQTGNLLEWQDSASSVIGYIAPGGQISTASTVAAQASIFARAGGPDVRPVVVRGAASQTANLIEWQDSAGTILSRVANDGTIWVGPTKLTAGSASANSALDTEILGFMGVF